MPDAMGERSIHIVPLLLNNCPAGGEGDKKMSKAKINKQLKEQIGDNDIPVELLALEPIGASIKEIIHQQMEDSGRPVYLSKDEREGTPPLHTVGDTNIEIKVNGVTLNVSRADGDKPSVVIPVGKSDVTTTMALNHNYNYSFLLSSLAHSFGGDLDNVQQVVDILNEIQDEATVTNDGRAKIDKTLLPDIHHKERITKMVESLTRRVKSRSKGTIQTNVSVEVTGLTPAPEPSSVTRSDILATPTPESPDSRIPVPVIVSPINTTEGDGGGMEGEGGDGDSPSFSDILKQREQITDALSSVLALGDLTIGNVRKGMAEIGFNDDDWRPRFDSMLQAGWITTNGASGRSCRYNWTGDE